MPAVVALSDRVEEVDGGDGDREAAGDRHRGADGPALDRGVILGGQRHDRPHDLLPVGRVAVLDEGLGGGVDPVVGGGATDGVGDGTAQGDGAGEGERVRPLRPLLGVEADGRGRGDRGIHP